MSLNGLAWLLIVGMIFVVLYLLAKHKENRNNKHSNTNSHQHGSNKEHMSSQTDGISTTSLRGIFNTIINKSTHKSTHKNIDKPQKSSKALRKLHQNLEKQLPEFSFNLRQNHITMTKNNTKVAMITLDKDTKQSQRKLGDVVVLNYHQAPNYQQILDALPPSV